MSLVLFTARLLQGARVNLRTASDVRDAAVDVGGYHFECGVRDFAAWSKVVKTELNLELGRPKFAAASLNLADVYVQMRERAFELAKEAAKNGNANTREISQSLNAFMKISKFVAGSSPPVGTSASAPSSGSTGIPVSQGDAGSAASSPGSAQPPSKPSARGAAVVGRAENPLERLLEELHSHIGLAAVKKDIYALANSMRVDRARRAQGLRVADRSLHMVFYGNPGTGKTTVARLVAQIYKELGVLKKGHLVCTDRAGLVANYVGQTAPKVAAVVREAIGGALFIDEAYSLAPPESQNDFGQEAVQQLLLLMENHRSELVVIVAGYPDEMARFLDANPGLSSRFTKKLHFEDYSPDQLVQIFEKICRDNDYRLREQARVKLLRCVQAAHDYRDKTFGNARFARNLFEEATKNLANRLVDSDLSDSTALMVIREDDIPDNHVASIKPSNPPSLFPDLGKYLAGKGTPQKTALIYSSWEIDDLAIVGRGHYCTTRIQPVEGNLYCATFDFGIDILEQILLRAPAATKAFIRRSLGEDAESIRHLPIPNPIKIGIVAILGSPQQGPHDSFVPLVITEVFGADPVATMEALGIDGSQG